ncbi:MAG: hypothetical protein ACRDJO_10825 [Actinomycetota bacterium]
MPAVAVAALTLLAAVVQGTAVQAAVPATEADYSGYATSTPVHVDAINTGGTVVADVEEAYSSALVASKGIAQITNEVGRNLTTSGPIGKNSAARGTALEVGLVQPEGAPNQIELKGVAEAFSLPSPGAASEEIGPVTIPGVAYASLLKSQANTRWNESGCILGGDPISRGYAYAADAQLVGSGAGPFTAPVIAADVPPKNVTDSISLTRLVAQTAADGSIVGPDFGLMTETRQHVAPIRLLDGAVIIEVAGEWVLRAVAGGVDGSGWVHYGPAGASPETPAVTITVGASVTQITTQDLLGGDGLVIPVNLPGVADIEIAVGEPPRAIGGAAGSTPAETPTEAAAAVDVVRVTIDLLDSIGVEDLRIGHMEARAKVPAGGIDCPIPVTKVTDPTSIGIGGSFTAGITIKNPYDCELTDVVATDNVTADGPTFTIPAASDGGTISGNTVTWNLGTIPPGGSKLVQVNIKAGRGSGSITDTVNVVGKCGIGSADGSTTVNVGLKGSTVLAVTVGATDALGISLPRTGGPTWLYLLGASLSAGGAVFAGARGLRLRKRD